MRDAVEIKKLDRGRIFGGFRRVLFQLYLFDVDPDLVTVLRGNTVVVEQFDMAVPREGLYSTLETHCSKPKSNYHSIV